MHHWLKEDVRPCKSARCFSILKQSNRNIHSVNQCSNTILYADQRMHQFVATFFCVNRNSPLRLSQGFVSFGIPRSRIKASTDYRSFVEMCYDNLRWFYPPLVVLDGVIAGGLGLLQSGRRTKGSRRSRPHLDCHRPSAQSRRSC